MSVVTPPCRFLPFVEPVEVAVCRFFFSFKKVVEMELKWTLRTVARSLDVENWFERTGDVLGVRQWSWFVRGGKNGLLTLHLNSAMVWGFVEVSSPLRNLARNLVFARNASYPLSH